MVLIGFNGDGGYRYNVDSQKLEEFLRIAFPSHRPSCLETGQPLDIEHHVVFNAFPVSSLIFPWRCIPPCLMLLCYISLSLCIYIIITYREAQQN